MAIENPETERRRAGLTPTRRAWLAGRPENGRLLERKRKLPSRRSQWPLLGSVQEMQNL